MSDGKHEQNLIIVQTDRQTDNAAWHQGDPDYGSLLRYSGLPMKHESKNAVRWPSVSG